MSRAGRLTRRGALVPIEIASRVLPRPCQRWLGVPVALALLFLFKDAREGIARNLDRVGGGRYSPSEVRRLTFRTFHHYGQYLADYMAILRLGRRIDPMFGSVEGTGRLSAALERGRGALVVTPHLGHWELGGALLALQGFPVNVATAPEPVPGVRALREEMRRRIGVRTLTLTTAAGALSLLPLLAALRRNEIVALLADRAPPGAGVRVPFFGRPTLLPHGPAILARTSGAPIVPVYVTINDNWVYDAVAEESFSVARTGDRARDLEEATRWVAGRFQAKIADHPDQWYNFYDFWSGESSDEEQGRNTL